MRESLIASMNSAELVAAAETLEADELADIAPDLPPAVIEEVVQSLPAEERERLRAALSYPEGSVGALMDFDHVAVRDDVTLEAATRYLRRLDELPGHTDQLFVVDREQRLKGTLPLARLIVSDLHLQVRRRDGPRKREAPPRGQRRGRGQRVRALRPGLGAGGRRRRTG